MLLFSAPISISFFVSLVPASNLRTSHPFYGIVCASFYVFDPIFLFNVLEKDTSLSWYKKIRASLAKQAGWTEKSEKENISYLLHNLSFCMLFTKLEQDFWAFGAENEEVASGSS